jgi:hypothetical protein
MHLATGNVSVLIPRTENDMARLYDDPVLEAAASREAGDSVGAWKLADALATAIPADRDNSHRHSSDGTGMTIPEQLAEYETNLASEGIETPAGGAYTVFSLRDLRDVAMRWPADKRYPQAAFRTHQEAGSPGSEADVALKALCKYAAGGAKRKPSEIDSAAWAKAIEQVDKLLARKARYAVSANTLRTAAQRKINTPPRNDAPVEPVVAESTPKAVAERISSDPLFRHEVMEAMPVKELEEFAADATEKSQDRVLDSVGADRHAPGVPDPRPEWQREIDKGMAHIGRALDLAMVADDSGDHEEATRIRDVVSERVARAIAETNPVGDLR